MENKLSKFDSNYKSIYKGIIAGVDEAGRGPWAGPVVAAAIILNPRKIDTLSEIDDSKKLTEKKREELYDVVMSAAKCFSVSEVSHTIIDRDNILQATLLGMKNSILKLMIKPDIVLIDGISKPVMEDFVLETVKSGDAKSLSIAAASILAKVHRDRIMRNYAKMYPGYGFEKHKGYGTKVHVEALNKIGVCDIHRKSYKPVQKIVEQWNSGIVE